MERKTGFEPATTTLARWSSTGLSYFRSETLRKRPGGPGKPGNPKPAGILARGPRERQGIGNVPATGPARDRTTVEYGDPLGLTLVAETQCHVAIPMPLSGPDRYDNNALSRVRLGRASGFGVMEWAAVLG